MRPCNIILADENSLNSDCGYLFSLNFEVSFFLQWASRSFGKKPSKGT
jgi:hypothetical protein